MNQVLLNICAITVTIIGAIVWLIVLIIERMGRGK